MVHTSYFIEFVVTVEVTIVVLLVYTPWYNCIWKTTRLSHQTLCLRCVAENFCS